jgi:Fic family protein
MEKPPYDINIEILNLVASISGKVAEVRARHRHRQSPTLRKQNQIRTIHSTLGIEGNTLSLSQVTAIIENKRVLGPEKDIREVKNALLTYEKLRSFKPFSQRDFLIAHKTLMQGLIDKPGAYRTGNVGIIKGSKIGHLAPPAENIHYLMQQLFTYLRDKSEPALIKSCVFHYELEFIHPFSDGNGRMGRLWQTRLLMEEYPLFEFLPFESLVAKNQKGYYEALSASDKEGKSTTFIMFMLRTIDQSLNEWLDMDMKKLGPSERLEAFLNEYQGSFSRKDYLKFFKDISTATASRDLKLGIETGLLNKTGDKINTFYRKRN